MQHARRRIWYNVGMKLTSILLAAAGGVLAVAIAGCESSGVPRPSNATLRTFGGPLVQAHRGSRGEYDDNAVGGFRMCLAKGIRGFETDIRFTKDRKLVIMHDSRADRTTDGKGIVEEMTLEELRKCRLQACSEPVPTLEDVLAVFNRRGDVFVELEMKAYPSAFYTPEVLADYCRALSATARRMMAPGTYAFTCFNTNTLATMRSVDASAPMGLITGKGLDDSHIAVAKSLGCCSIAPIGKATTREMVGKAHAEGLSICLWMCQNKADWDEYAAKGADRVTSDYPVLLSRAIEGRPKKVVAMDLDATLCQHRSPIPERNLEALRKLENRYKCVMVGAGNAPRIYKQMGNYPIDIVANYGMQVAEAADGNFRIVKAVTNSVDRKFFREQTDALRKKYGYTEYEGEPLEFHASGMVTFGLLGTSPSAEHKVVFDPDRKKRRAMYPEVCEIFKDFSVYIGGSTSFDFAGKEYNKYDATLVWAKEHGYTLDDVVFIGDDFADGGGDSHVRIKGMDHIVITDYKKFADAVEVLLKVQTPASSASRLHRAAPVSTYKVDLDRPGGLYRCGETATFKVTLLSTNSLVCGNRPCVSLDNFGVSSMTNIPFDVSATGVVFLVSGTLREPGFLRLSLPPTKSGRDDPFVFSAGFEPEKIVKGSPSPADFDAFWAESKARLAREVPLDPQVVRVPERSTADFDFYRISFATFGRRVHGYMSVPTDKSKAPFPVDFGVNAAGFGSWTNDMSGEKDSIRVQFSVYPFAPDWKWKENGLKAKYWAMDAELKKRYGAPRYCQAGITESREAYFFYPVILGIDRAVDWVAARPDVDRSRFRYEGTSQGGGFGFYLCGLNRTFTKAAFYVPAITDTMGYLKGRDSGWPKIVENNSSTPERRAAAEKWAPYFDGANFASRIACPVRVAVGFSDTTCPPCAVYAAFNEIKVADKAIGHGIGMTHSCSGRFYAEFGKWVKSSASKE